MRFAQRTFLLASIYGLLAIAPLYFLEQRIAVETPPAITHPEFYYGFVGVGLAWQVAFLVIARDPLRFRPIMPVAVLEKLGFGVAAAVLYAQGRVPGMIAGLGAIDLAFAVAFALAWMRCGQIEATR